MYTCGGRTYSRTRAGRTHVATHLLLELHHVMKSPSFTLTQSLYKQTCMYKDLYIYILYTSIIACCMKWLPLAAEVLLVYNGDSIGVHAATPSFHFSQCPILCTT